MFCSAAVSFGWVRVLMAAWVAQMVDAASAVLGRACSSPKPLPALARSAKSASHVANFPVPIPIPSHPKATTERVVCQLAGELLERAGFTGDWVSENLSSDPMSTFGVRIFLPATPRSRDTKDTSCGRRTTGILSFFYMVVVITEEHGRAAYIEVGAECHRLNNKGFVAGKKTRPPIDQPGSKKTADTPSRCRQWTYRFTM